MMSRLRPLLGRTGVVVAPLSWLCEVVEGVSGPWLVPVVSVLPGEVVPSVCPPVVLAADVVLGAITGCEGTTKC